MTGAPSFSRTGDTDPDGKLSVRREVCFTEKEYEELSGVAVLMGMPVSECIRLACRTYLHGQLGVIRSKLHGLHDTSKPHE